MFVMENISNLINSACCAPIPREINNYYNRCHSKNKSQFECKGACYCPNATCKCTNKGLNERYVKTNNCQCYSCPKGKETFLNTEKKTCPKCKASKKQCQSSQPVNHICHCCCQLNTGNSPKKQESHKTPDKKHTASQKSYDKSDNTLLNSSQIADRQPVNNLTAHRQNAKNKMTKAKVGNNGQRICTCGLLRPCDCAVAGMWSVGGGAREAAPPCRRCGRKVYAAEKLMASGGAFHTSCFSCYCCHKALGVANLYENQGEIYCKQCYTRFFGMTGYGYGTTLLSPI